MNLHDQNTVIFYAFRYALGRATYAVGDVIEIIETHLDIITQYNKHLMIKEIKQAIEYDRAGWDCDRKDWEELLEKLSIDS